MIDRFFISKKGVSIYIMKYEKAYQNQRYVPLSPVVFSIELKVILID